MEAARTKRRSLRVPPALEPLVRQLAALPDEDRKAVVQAAENARRPQRAVASWDTLDSLRGVVRLGGDAIEDCDRLYDG
ncbi:hypothetical protein [Pendulispora albinea]|uniref:Uncharacterized protein n=1 Tax=Pendulispora albinea TaxID=2741071 RepID=A0ABZ2LZQ8_9BACT